MTDKNPTSDKLRAIITITDVCCDYLLDDSICDTQSALATIKVLAQDMLDDITHNTNNKGKDNQQ